MEECHRLLTDQVDFVNPEGHRADYNEYKISKADFKNLHPNNFEDLYLLHLQGKLNHLPRSDKTKLNLTEPRWDASDFLFKKDYTIVTKARVVIYRDRNDQKKLLRENEVHKFSYGTLIKVLHKLDHMVKDFRLYQYNPGMENRIWSEDDKKRNKEFMENIRVIPKYLGEDGNSVRVNIKPTLGRDKFITVILDQHIQGNHESSSICIQDQERYEHVGPQDTRPQDGKRSQDGERSQDDDQRLDLADDLKKAQDHISSSNISHETKSTASKYKISHKESKTTS
uniref:Uncharacterized protein n=1 Tax=Tanacetum cinerariifolium TaxID=118510 RepID=A0A699GYD4_TANCI|nr:hypothetical protein [Tanacetum cinerariifolium]